MGYMAFNTEVDYNFPSLTNSKKTAEVIKPMSKKNNKKAYFKTTVKSEPFSFKRWIKINVPSMNQKVLGKIYELTSNFKNLESRFDSINSSIDETVDTINDISNSVDSIENYIHDTYNICEDSGSAFDHIKDDLSDMDDRISESLENIQDSIDDIQNGSNNKEQPNYNASIENLDKKIIGIVRRMNFEIISILIAAILAVILLIK